MQSDILSLVRIAIKKLDESAIDYMIVGSFASSYYGEPRLTKDIDIVIEAAFDLAGKMAKNFSSNEFYIPPAELLAENIANRQMFNVLQIASGFKIDFIPRKLTEHAKTEFARKRIVNLIGDLNVKIASPEDVILRKLQYYLEGESEKHLRDIRGMVAQTEIDENYLMLWLQKLRLQEAWAKI